MDCCYVDQNTEERCSKAAEWEILSQGAHPSMTTQACTEHVGALLENGTTSVWPMEGN